VPPSHYTDETPEGALEAMERRLQEVLATMDLRVGELAEAIQQMGATSIPVPVVEAIEDAVEAITVAAEEATSEVRTEGGASNPRGRAIRSYLQELGQVEAAKLDVRDVRQAVMEKHPELGEISLKDVANAVRPLASSGYTLRPARPPVRRGAPAPVEEQTVEATEEVAERTSGRTPSPRTLAIRAFAKEKGQELKDWSSTDIVNELKAEWPEMSIPTVLNALTQVWREANDLPPLKRAARAGQSVSPPAPAPAPVGRPGTPTTTEEIESLEERTAAIYMDGLGDDLTGKTAEEIRADLIYQWPDITLAQIRNGWNSLRWIRHAQGQPRPPMLRASDAPGTIEGLLGGAGDLRPERMRASWY